MDATLDILINILSKNLWVGLLVIVIYGIWKAAPVVFQMISDHLRSKNEELNKITGALEGNSLALDKISSAIYSFEKALVGSESRMREELHAVRDDIKEEIRDHRLQELTRPPPSNAIIKRQKTFPPK